MTLAIALSIVVTVALAAAAIQPSSAAALRAFLDVRARRDFATFVALVGRDERTGAPLVLSANQRKMISHWLAHPRSVVFGHPELGKTTLLILLVVWRLALDPSARIVIASGTAGQAEKLLRASALCIETNADLHRIFPQLKPGAIHRADAYSVADAPATMKDANILTASPGSGALLGTRVDFLFIDDLLNRENTRSPERREELHRWVVSTLMSRLAPAAQILANGTVWHPSDELHLLERLPGFVSLRLPILDSVGASTWPARWPHARIEERRAELGPREFARAFMCTPAADGACTFDSALVRAMVDRGLALPTTFYSSPAGRHVVGVDVAFSTGPKSDKSALVVVRACDDGQREIVHVESGRWNLDTLAARVVEVTHAFGATAAIESNGGGNFVLEQVRKRAPAVALHTSATSKLARVEMLHAEMSAGRWLFRPMHGVLTEGMRSLADGLETYSPDEHTPDDVAALLVAVEQVRARENRPTAQVFPKHLILGHR